MRRARRRARCRRPGAVEAPLGEHPHARVEQPRHRLATLRAQLALATRRACPRRCAALRHRSTELCDPERHASRRRPRGRPAVRRSYRLRHAQPAGRSTYADLDRISDEVAAGLARRGVGEGDVVALVLPPGPEYLLAYLAAAKLGAITAGRERPALRARARRACSNAPARARGRGTRARARRPTTRRRGRDRRRRRDDVLAGCASTATPAGPPRRSRPAGRDHLHVGHDRRCRRARSTRTASSRSSPRPTSATRGAAAAARFSGTSFAHLGFMTKLPGNLQRGGTTFIMRRGAPTTRCELVDRERMTTVGRRADPDRADAARAPTSTRTTSTACGTSSSAAGR